jgi:hypothetical protein
LRANLAGLSSPLILNLTEWNQLEEIIRLAAVFRWLDEHSGWLLRCARRAGFVEPCELDGRR